MTQPPRWTTAAVEALPTGSDGTDATPGLVLVYSRLHTELPSVLPLLSSSATIGREPDNTFPIPEAAVSRYHARLERREDGIYLIDNGSTNGTMVGGQRVRTHRLADHDVVRIGDTLFRFASRGVLPFAAYMLDGSIRDPREAIKHGIAEPELIGGYQISCLLERISKVAPTSLSVIVMGESGTGKEVVARELHRSSGRRGPFQAINCAALPPNLIESELFGHRRGAFTGAVQDKIGLVRAAHGGTLFLDEIGDMPLEAQSKLLRVLQEREVSPIGATTPERVDVRVVAATHRDLEAQVLAGTFRGDLLARLRELAIHLPALRERREDVYLLARHFLARAGRAEVAPTFTFMLALVHYGWPYNVRELESAVKLSLVLAEGRREVDLVHLPDQVRRALDQHGGVAASSKHPPSFAPSSGEDSMSTTRETGRTPSEDELRALLTRHRGNIAAVGRDLGKERMQIHRWLKRYAIRIEDYRE